MIILDANVLIRYLVQDNKEMADKAEEVIEKNICLIPMEVIAEVVYVLQKVYQIERDIIKAVLSDLLDDDHITLPHEDIVRSALRVYRESRLDFVDCLLVGYAELPDYEIFTFDQKLQKRIVRFKRNV